MTKLEIALAAFALAVAGFGVGSFAGWSYGVTTTEHRQQKLELAIEASAQASREAAAQEIAKIKPVNKTIQQKVIHEITEKSVYSDCRVPASGVQSANQAITGQVSDSGELPKTD